MIDANQESWWVSFGGGRMVHATKTNMDGESLSFSMTHIPEDELRSLAPAHGLWLWGQKEVEYKVEENEKRDDGDSHISSVESWHNSIT